MKPSAFHSLLAALCLCAAPVLAAPATSFNYQGYLAESNGAASGSYYFQFAVFGATTGGTALVTVAQAAPLVVNAGYFNTVINHSTVPALFADGQVKYLEIRVKKNAGDAYTTLTPRQEIHPAPMAQNVDGLLSRNNAFTGNNTFSGSTSFAGGTVSGGTFNSISLTGTNLFSGANTFNGTSLFNSSPTFNNNATVMGDLLLSGADSQLNITTDSGFPATFNGSSFGGTWITIINQRSVLSNTDTPQEWNFIATGVDNGEGPRKFLLRDGTAQAVRLTVDEQGDVGIGTTNPQAKLDIATGNNRSLRIKDDLVPTLEATGGAGDALRGYMRVRNVMEVFPRADGTAPGKVDVRNTAGSPTITLDGGTGVVTATAVSAANLPAIKYAQLAVSQRSGSVGGYINSQQNKDMDSIDVTAPAAGFLMVQAMVQTGASGGNSLDTGAYFKLLAGPPGGTMTEQIENASVTSNNGSYITIPITWVIPVTAGQAVRLTTNLYNRGGSSWSYYSHTLHALFIPNEL